MMIDTQMTPDLHNLLSNLERFNEHLDTMTFPSTTAELKGTKLRIRHEDGRVDVFDLNAIKGVEAK